MIRFINGRFQLLTFHEPILAHVLGHATHLLGLTAQIGDELSRQLANADLAERAAETSRICPLRGSSMTYFSYSHPCSGNQTKSHVT